MEIPVITVIAGDTGDEVRSSLLKARANGAIVWKYSDRDAAEPTEFDRERQRPNHMDSSLMPSLPCENVIK